MTTCYAASIVAMLVVSRPWLQLLLSSVPPIVPNLEWSITYSSNGRLERAAMVMAMVIVILGSGISPELHSGNPPRALIRTRCFLLFSSSLPRMFFDICLVWLLLRQFVAVASLPLKSQLFVSAMRCHSFRASLHPSRVPDQDSRRIQRAG